MIEPRTWAQVTSLVRERIIWVCGCEGHEVATGDALARLDDSEAAATLDELKARLRFAVSERDRLAVLAGRNITSRSELDRAESDLAQVEAMIAGQEARLASYVLRSPSDGLVLRQDVEVGEIAEPGTVLFWVGRPNPRIVVAEVNEEDIPRVAVGQRALLRSDAFPGRQLEAEVASITPKGDPVAKTYRVRLALPEDTPLLIGMSVDVNIVIRVVEAALLVPTAAVRDGAVFVVEDGRARRREVDDRHPGQHPCRGALRPRRGRAHHRAVPRGPGGRRAGDGGLMRLILAIALTHIAGRGRQTVVAVIGVAVGVGFSIAMAALMQGGQDDFVAQLIDTMPHVADHRRPPRPAPPARRGRLRRRGDHGASPARGPARHHQPHRGHRLARGLGAGAARGKPERAGGGALLRQRDRRHHQRHRARDRARRLADRRRFRRRAASTRWPQGATTSSIGDRMAGRLGAGHGRHGRMVSSSGLSRNFRIVGLFHTGNRARDEGEAYVLLKNAQILSARPNAINDIRIKLDDPYAAPAVAHQAEAELGYRAVAWQDADEALLEAFVVRNVIMYTVVAAIMLVAGFGIFNIVSTITHEKARDIAIMKSLGFSRGDMQAMFVIEGVAIGAAGSGLGCALGFGLTYVLAGIRFELAAAGQEMTHLPVTWSALHYLIASGFALGSAAVAGYLPARRAARLHPVDIIRGAT